MTEPSRSPIKDRPLRHAAQSLEEERRKLLEDKVEPWLLLAAMFFVMACLEWWRYYSNAEFNPLLFTLVALATVLFAAWRVFRLKPRFRALRQGIDGEKAVGQFLERLRAEGYQVFHDVVAPGFNVDHVLIGPAGVFAIETKTWSKPVRGEAHIDYDGERLLVAGFEPDRDPVVQAKAQATWLRGVLVESTGKSLEVRSVILFPGWFVKQAEGIPRTPWVLEPKALPAFLQHEPQRLSSEDAKLAAYHLSRYVRSVEKERVG